MSSTGEVAGQLQTGAAKLNEAVAPLYYAKESASTALNEIKRRKAQLHATTAFFATILGKELNESVISRMTVAEASAREGSDIITATLEGAGTNNEDAEFAAEWAPQCAKNIGAAALNAQEAIGPDLQELMIALGRADDAMGKIVEHLYETIFSTMNAKLFTESIVDSTTNYTNTLQQGG